MFFTAHIKTNQIGMTGFDVISVIRRLIHKCFDVDGNLFRLGLGWNEHNPEHTYTSFRVYADQNVSVCVLLPISLLPKFKTIFEIIDNTFPSMKITHTLEDARFNNLPDQFNSKDDSFLSCLSESRCCLSASTEGEDSNIIWEIH